MRKIEFAYLNDKLVDIEQASVSINDLGLLYGVGLFETICCHYGKPFQLENHISRLFQSARSLNMQLTIEPSHIEYAITELMSANEIEGSARVRLTLTPGNLRQANAETVPPNTLILTCTSMPKPEIKPDQPGMQTCLSNQRQYPDDPNSRFKCLNYFRRLQALQQAQQKKCGEALWFTPKNLLAQACTANIFLVQDGQIYTPSLNTPVIAGITRQLVIKLAKQCDLPITEKPLTLENIKQASEVFLTNSAMGLMPVHKFEQIEVGPPNIGPICQTLFESYLAEIERLH